jgi:hypothetical protein
MPSLKCRKDLEKYSSISIEADQSTNNLKYFFHLSIGAVVCEEDMAIYALMESPLMAFSQNVYESFKKFCFGILQSAKLPS